MLDRFRYHLQIEGIDGAKGLHDRLAGKYSIHQIRRWLSHTDSTDPSAEDLILIHQEVDVSSNWVFWGIGPRRLSDCTKYENAFKLLEEVHDRVVK